ncbi:nitrogenase component 1 type oxidoreductase [methanogenic archaeon mixed culture ISO4-G1]|nr:nitrogenase component 1 type oxidoreductase [methanogenic archaeon mixed culture ISO4-G1]
MVKPDGFIGTVMAAEGIADSTTLLHGPDGCRKNLSVLSNKVFPRDNCCKFDMGTPYYHNMPRLPCTGIISTDYIVGAQGKLSDALRFVSQYEDNMITVVSSPGASLIGDDVNKAINDSGFESLALALDSSLISKSCGYGMDRTLEKIADFIIKDARPTVKDTVNILGLNVLSKDWQTVRKELDEILGSLGLKVTCYLGAGCTVDEIRRSASAEFNVILSPEYSKETASYYKRRFGIPAICLGYAPVGFDAIKEFIDLICERTRKDPKPARDYLGAYMQRAYRCMRSARIEVKGRTFAIDADPSTAYPLTKWLYESLAMVPVSIRSNGEDCGPLEHSLSTFLEQNHLGNCLDSEVPDFVDCMICDGNTAKLYELSKHCRRGVDVCFPSIQNVDFRESPVLGCRGAMYLLDRIMNAL